MFNFAQVSLYLVLGWYAFAWGLTQSWVEALGLDSTYELTRSALFLVFTSLVSALLDLPLKAYSAFVIEQRFGFNTQVGLWGAVAMNHTIVDVGILRVGPDEAAGGGAGHQHVGAVSAHRGHPVGRTALLHLCMAVHVCRHARAHLPVPRLYCPALR